MNYEEFKQEIQDSIKDYLSDKYADASVRINDVVKNNDMHLDGLTIVSPDSNMSPTIYLNSFFEEYQDGKSMEDILDKIAEIYEEHAVDHNMDISSITEFDQAKDKVVARVINAEQNEDLLADRPHTLIEDLAVTYHINLGNSEDGAMSCAITNSLAETYGVTAEDLHEIAMANMEEINKPTFKGMTEVMMEMMGGELPEGFPMPEGPEQMYVLSNESKLNGAAAMLDTNLMDQIAEKLDGDYFILPSSVHEVLIVPMQGEMDRENLENMVQEVNATQVSPEERLSDHVYAYDAEAHEIMRADRYEEAQANKDAIVADMPRDQFEKGKAKKAEKAEKAETSERSSLKARLDEKKAEAAKTERKAPKKDLDKKHETSL